MTITPEEIARLREALEIDTEPFLLYRHNLSGMLDEIERLQDELLTVRTVYHHRCECGEDDACQFARERDEARAELAVMTGYRDSLARRIQELKDARSGEEYRADVADAALREAVALLGRVAEFHLQSNNEGELAREADALFARRDALLAKHSL